MTLFKHEMRQGSKSLAVWTAVISFVIAVCVFMYPEMKGEMDGVSDMFASMGAFTEAFGMDKVNFGTLIGFYTIECGNVFGIGGAFFVALLASGILSKEEKDGTAEFLITHPVRRSRIVSEKLLALVAQIALLNAAVFCVSVVSVTVIDEQLPWKEFCLIHFAYFLLQLEL
ncbi:MAG: ABC transporter permease subunit, partial [Clostridia bacterium]|nr:ABC transporter permease subunit [Clostridia bacterium]